jgi:hypothetical protein
MPIDWEQIQKVKYAPDQPPMEWPTGVRPISLQGLTLFGIGPDDRLYWDGHAIKVERTVSLNWWQNLLAVMTAFGAAASGVAALLTYLVGHSAN